MSRSLGSFPFRLRPYSTGHLLRAVIVSASLIVTASCAGLPSVPTPTITPTSRPTETPRPTLTPTAMPSPTRTPVPPFGSTAMALYQAETFPFSIQIPADWELTDHVSEPGREVSIYQGQAGSLVILQSIDLATVEGIPEEITLDDYMQLYLPELASGGINTEIVSNVQGNNCSGPPVPGRRQHGGNAVRGLEHGQHLCPHGIPSPGQDTVHRRVPGAAGTHGRVPGVDQLLLRHVPGGR